MEMSACPPGGGGGDGGGEGGASGGGGGGGAVGSGVGGGQTAAVAEPQAWGVPIESKDLLWREERRARRRKLRQERMSERQRRYGLLICAASAVDVIISGFMACVAFAHGYRDSGVSLYCVGIQSLSHALSSLMLALRFGDEARQPEDAPAGPEDGLLRQRRRVYLVREKLLSFFMGCVMMLSSGALLLKAIRKMLYWDIWYQDHLDMDKDARFATIFLSWYGALVYAAQALVRGMSMSIIRRSVVSEATICSLVSLTFLVVIGTAAVLEDERSWKAEPIAAIILGGLTISEGIRLIRAHWGDVDLRLDLDPFA